MAACWRAAPLGSQRRGRCCAGREARPPLGSFTFPWQNCLKVKKMLLKKHWNLICDKGLCQLLDPIQGHYPQKPQPSLLQAVWKQLHKAAEQCTRNLISYFLNAACMSLSSKRFPVFPKKQTSALAHVQLLKGLSFTLSYFLLFARSKSTSLIINNNPATTHLLASET